MNPQKFVQLVANTKLPNTFNPYSDRCEMHDKACAPKERRSALLKLLQTASELGTESLWIGRDLGYRGGRRTGMALTDEIHVQSYAKRWNIPITTVTKGPLVSERTADVIWSILDQIPERVFLWNVFPFHPYEDGSPFTNRAHSAAERKIGEEILVSLIEIIRPKKLVAIGNDAAASLRRQNFTETIKFRHPSFGGQTEFLQQARQVYGLPAEPPTQNLLF